jgi:5-methyltetrahydropteroyltriglutamate--homocysteine methyltransferase
LFAAGANVVQLDEPFLQAQPDKAREFGVAAINRALENTGGTTAMHLCFGYGARVADKPSAYSFLPELAGCIAHQISIETAQPKVDCAILRSLPGKQIMLGVLDLGTHEIETPDTVAARIRNALPYVSADRLIIAPDCGLKYLPRDTAFAKLKSMVDGAAIVRRELTS